MFDDAGLHQGADHDEQAGVVKHLARLAITATGGNTLTATMAPVVADLVPALGDHANPAVLWWSLAPIAVRLPPKSVPSASDHHNTAGLA
ncbi:hypothetical protein MAHJHV59_49720 [Mycobacterium avium subsp. hominissuis]